jgi:hypothetical protein
MSDETVSEDVNAGEDRVTDDHDAGLGTSAEDMETHNPDIADYDKVIADMDAEDGEEDEASGGTVNTDDSDTTDADASDADKDTKDDKDEPRIPRARLNEVLEREKEQAKTFHEKELEWARKEAIFEGRLAALEKPVEEVEPVVDPLDDILKGEPQEVLDAFTADPTGFVRMIQTQAKAQGAAEIQARREEERRQSSLTSAMDKFAADHEDFEEIAVPLLRSQLEEATKGVEDKVSAAKAEGIAEGKKLAIKEIQAKGNAQVLDGSSASQTGAKANAGAGLQTGGDATKLREKLTADLLKSRGE